LKKPSDIKRRKPAPSRIVFLFDVDNTLLDNDQVQADLQKHLAEEVEARGAKLYWAFFEDLRRRLGYADYLGALQRFAPAGGLALFDRLSICQPPLRQFPGRSQTRRALGSGGVVD
jgi:hypothetical protein